MVRRIDSAADHCGDSARSAPTPPPSRRSSPGACCSTPRVTSASRSCPRATASGATCWPGWPRRRAPSSRRRAACSSAPASCRCGRTGSATRPPDGGRPGPRRRPLARSTTRGARCSARTPPPSSRSRRPTRATRTLCTTSPCDSAASPTAGERLPRRTSPAGTRSTSSCWSACRSRSRARPGRWSARRGRVAAACSLPGRPLPVGLAGAAGQFPSPGASPRRNWMYRSAEASSVARAPDRIVAAQPP